MLCLLGSVPVEVPFATLQILFITGRTREKKSRVAQERIVAAPKMMSQKRGRASLVNPLISNLESRNPDMPEKEVR